MGKVIEMGTHANTIPPKVSVHEHAGQRYTIRYDPISKRWVWVVSYTETYTFFGEASTAEGASKEARRKIHNMTTSAIEFEERNATK